MTHFECDKDFEAANALFTAAETWAKLHKLNHIYGPKGFSAMDSLGLLVRGYEHPATMGMAYHHPYYAGMFEQAGYRAMRELLTGRITEESAFPDTIFKLAERVKERRGLYIKTFESRREIHKYIPEFTELYNQSLADNLGNVQISEDELRSMIRMMLWFADPGLIKLVMKKERVVGFVIGYPDLAEAIRRSKGRLFPFGFLDMLREKKRTKVIDLNGIGIREEYRGGGGVAILFSEIVRSILDGNYTKAELMQVGAENTRMLQAIRKIDIDFYKVHRIYEKDLACDEN